MDFRNVLADRWSCRAYLDEEVPEATLREMFALAQRTASSCNTQPWGVYLVGGEPRERLAKELVDSVVSGPGGSDLPMPEKYVGVYQERRREAGYALYESLDIAREDREARDLQMLKNFTSSAPRTSRSSPPTPIKGCTAPSTAAATWPTCSMPTMTSGWPPSRRPRSRCRPLPYVGR